MLPCAGTNDHSRLRIGEEVAWETQSSAGDKVTLSPSLPPCHQDSFYRLLRENDGLCTSLCLAGSNMGNNIPRGVSGSPVCFLLLAPLILPVTGSPFLAMETAAPIATVTRKDTLCHEACCLNGRQVPGVPCRRCCPLREEPGSARARRSPPADSVASGRRAAETATGWLLPWSEGVFVVAGARDAGFRSI